MRICTACHFPQALEDFSPKKRFREGRNTMCRSCERAQKERWRRRKGQQARPDFLHRIWDNIQQCDHGDTCLYCCWPWIKKKYPTGYGFFTYRLANGKQVGHPVTRIIYEIWHAKPIPKGYLVCHDCPDGDLKSCCNPLHLWLGTHQENMQDAIKKEQHASLKNGRWRKAAISRAGEKHSMAKLTAAEILAIRTAYAAGVSTKSLATQYPVSIRHLHRIVSRQNWNK